MEINLNKKPLPDFFVRMVGPGVRPWNVPLRVLAKVLEATQRLAEPPSDDVSIQGDDEDTEIESDVESGNKPVLRLIDIKKGSAGYLLAAPKDAVSRLRLAGESIENPADADWSASQVRSIEELSAIAKSQGCEIEYRVGSLNGEVIAKITPSTFMDVEGNAFISGETSVLGVVERVGGATKLHCGLRLGDQSRMLICKVTSADVARDLGKCLYQSVMVSGRAQWLRKNWEIKRFEIRSFEPPKTGSALMALKLAHAAGAKAWDEIDDPKSYIANMRG